MTVSVPLPVQLDGADANLFRLLVHRLVIGEKRRPDGIERLLVLPGKLPRPPKLGMLNDKFGAGLLAGRAHFVSGHGRIIPCRIETRCGGAVCLRIDVNRHGRAFRFSVGMDQADFAFIFPVGVSAYVHRDVDMGHAVYKFLLRFQIFDSRTVYERESDVLCDAAARKDRAPVPAKVALRFSNVDDAVLAVRVFRGRGCGVPVFHVFYRGVEADADFIFTGF